MLVISKWQLLIRICMFWELFSKKSRSPKRRAGTPKHLLDARLFWCVNEATKSVYGIINEREKITKGHQLLIIAIFRRSRFTSSGSINIFWRRGELGPLKSAQKKSFSQPRRLFLMMSPRRILCNRSKLISVINVKHLKKAEVLFSGEKLFVIERYKLKAYKVV